MQMQTLNIIPNGLVKGGTGAYTENEATGALTYAAAVRVGLGFLTKTYSSKGEYKVDPSLLKSEAVSVKGSQITIGKVLFTVLDVSRPGAVLVSFSVAGQPVSGTMVLDVTVPNFKIKSISAISRVLGMDLRLQFEPVPSSRFRG